MTGLEKLGTIDATTILIFSIVSVPFLAWIYLEIRRFRHRRNSRISADVSRPINTRIEAEYTIWIKTAGDYGFASAYARYIYESMKKEHPEIDIDDLDQKEEWPEEYKQACAKDQRTWALHIQSSTRLGSLLGNNAYLLSDGKLLINRGGPCTIEVIND